MSSLYRSALTRTAASLERCVIATGPPPLATSCVKRLNDARASTRLTCFFGSIEFYLGTDNCTERVQQVKRLSQPPTASCLLPTSFLDATAGPTPPGLQREPHLGAIESAVVRP